MQVLELSTWERIRLVNMIGSLQDPRKQNIRFVRSCLRLLDILELTDGEERQVGFVENEAAGDFARRVRWQDTEREFELNFEDADAELLHRLVTEYTGWEISRQIDVLVGKIEGSFGEKRE